MPKQRDQGAINQLFSQHDELADTAQELRGDDATTAVDRVIRMLRQHEIAEAPVMEAARSALPAEMVSEYEERWRTICELAAGLRDNESLPPDQVDQIIGMLYDHTIDVNGNIYGLLYLQLSDDQFADMNRKVAERISSTY